HSAEPTFLLGICFNRDNLLTGVGLDLERIPWLRGVRPSGRRDAGRRDLLFGLSQPAKAPLRPESRTSPASAPSLERAAPPGIQAQTLAIGPPCRASGLTPTLDTLGLAFR